ncbi:MAG TPA: amidohydrolase family protein [Acidimicrobiales bacterium]|nr:amidohydrolase family protein [Acidimicrobiales bacterium]
MGDLLVRGGRVIDGTGRPAVTADVRVRGDVIVEVGPSLANDGEQELDAGGAFVTPGFIDIHTHYDGSIWWDPSVDPMPQHGVTTVVTGNCAISLAPLNPEDQGALTDMFCYIEDLPVGPVSTAVPWTWRTWAEYRGAFNAMGASCNVAPLVGHSNIRMAVLGQEAFDRAASEDERAQLIALTLDCMDAGAFGVSLSFVDLDSKGRRVPSRLASPDELRDLGSALAGTGRGLVQYVPRFMRTDGYLKDIDRVAAACGEAGVAHTYAPVLTGRRSRETTDAVMAHTNDVRASGGRVWPQVSPRSGFDTRVVFDGSTAPYAGMPAWAAMAGAPWDEKAAMLADPAWRERARDDWASTAFTLFPKHALETFVVSAVSNPALREYEGLPFRRVLDARPGHPADVLAQWVLETRAEPNLVRPGSGDEDPDHMAALLADEGTLVGASDAGAHVLLFCGAGDTTLLLTRHVRSRGDLSLETAVHKLTGQAASAFGIRGRGVVAPGYAGDLTVFDLDELAYEREVLVGDMPGGAKRFTRPGAGFRATVVAGTVTQEGGVATDARPGRMLHSALA